MGGIRFSAVSAVSPPAGAPIGARNGLSVDAGGFAVLGQSVADPLNKGIFLSAREISQNGFGFNVFGGGVEFSQGRKAPNASGVGIHVINTTGVNVVRVGIVVGAITRDLFTFQDNGIFSVNDVNTGVSGIAMKSQRFVNAPLGTATLQAFSITSTWRPDNSQDPAFINDMEVGSNISLPNVADVEYAAWNVTNILAQAAGAAGNIRGLWYHPSYSAGPLANQHIAMILETGDVLLNTDTASVNGLSRTGIQGVLNPSAFLEIGIGPNDGSPGTGQLKLQQATILLAPEDGVIEYDGVHYYATIGATRHQIVLL